MYGATCTDAEVVAELLSAGANAGVVDDRGRTALHYAAKANQLGAIHLLIEHRAEIDRRALTGCTPLAEAARCGNVSAVKTLFDAHASVSGALGQAARGGRVEIARLLIAAGANINEIAADGRT